MSAMEVWIVSNFPPPVHGVSVFNEALCGVLTARGIEQRIFPIGTRGALNQLESVNVAKLASDGARIAEVAWRGRRSPRPFVLYFTPSQGGAAVYRDLLLARTARLLGVPLVAHIHGCGWLDRWRRGGMQARVMNHVLAACDEIICLGPTYAVEMSSALGLRCIGINNGVAAQRVDIKAPPNAGERIELLFLSNLIRAKGLWTAASAATDLANRGVDVRLRCAGSWFSALDERAFRTDFDEPIRRGVIELVGFANAETKPGLFASSHFLVFPTEYPLEGQPLALIEAMAAGLVPITTEQGAIRDLLAFPRAAELASASHRRPAEIAQTVLRLSETTTYTAFSNACIQRFHEALTLERCTNAVIETLQVAFKNSLQRISSS
jgi:glycosyltransferase involved in cell wall biosynthesis